MLVDMQNSDRDVSLLSRRGFLAGAARVAAAGWLTAELDLLTACARDTSRGARVFKHLSAAEGRALNAFAAQIIPAGYGAPGAVDAGAAYFVDRAIDMAFFAQQSAVVRSGLAELDSRAHAVGHSRDFASASDAEQIAIMRAIESTAFFSSTRTLIVIGTFADPKYGGNRDGAGWALLGIEHRPSYTAPFGWYDSRLSLDEAAGAAAV
jgi:hypothetical protein